MLLRAVVRPSKGWDKLVGATWSNRNFPDLLMDGGRRKGELEQEEFVGMAMEILVSNCIISLVKDKCGTRLSSDSYRFRNFKPLLLMLLLQG
jgi:hypothetical protein